MEHRIDDLREFWALDERKAVTELEKRRLALQEALDAGKTQADGIVWVSYSTPTRLAADILRHAAAQLGESEKIRSLTQPLEPVRSIQPCLTFFRKTASMTPQATRSTRTTGAGGPPVGETGLDMRLEDFTQAEPPPDFDRFNLLICNPPYVRHHHIGTGENSA